MGNAIVIVFVLGLLVWVVTNVVKAQQEDQKTTKRTPTSSQPRTNTTPARATTDRPMSDIDRFLQEIDRLRQASNTPPANTTTTTENAPSRPRPSQAISQPVANRPNPPRPKPVQTPQTVTPPKPAIRQAPTVDAAPATTLQVREVTAPVSQHLPHFVAPVLESELPTMPLGEQQLLGSTPVGVSNAGAARVQFTQPDAKNLQTLIALQNLLKNPRAGTAAAILLAEMLGRPKCKRRS